ncbi:MAG TPA: DUF559 domain-containing protein [Blastocatellia bacterium]|jgi:very-short-patch-repair endonuclease|nr:DUF559 domain-containing protein [Blastocatellia bacterium]
MTNSNAKQLPLFNDARNFTQPHESFIEARLAHALNVREIPHKREHPIGRYRADFAFLEHSLIVEVDGYEFHHTKNQREHDAQRDRIFMLLGWRVIRFTGSEIHRDIERCVAVITLLLKTLANSHQEAKAA